jgi:hypothetical protein
MSLAVTLKEPPPPGGAAPEGAGGEGAGGEEERGRGGESLMARLRGEAWRRPAVDPGLAGGLRDWLEDGLSEAAGALAPGAPSLRVTKAAVHQVLSCELHAAGGRGASRPLTWELVRGSLVDALFRQWITTGALDDPLADAAAALDVAGDPHGVLGYLDGLGPRRRGRLAGELALHAGRIAADWPVPAASWLGRTQERLAVPLAGGRVVLSGVVDLVLGAPSGGRASVCIVEVSSGRRRLEDRDDLHFYALLETLRSGAPPFRAATYYSATGELDVEPVGRDVLVGALERVLAAARALCRLAAGGAPRTGADPRCAWCAGVGGRRPGRRAGAAVATGTGRWA